MPSLRTLGLRRRVARRADRFFASLGLVEPRPAPKSQAPPSVTLPEAAPFSAARPYAAAPAPAAAPSAPAPTPPAPAPPSPGAELDLAEVQEIFDEMIRPALQSDGGDIELLGITGGDVRVRLVGACSSCPSSVLTMKMGIERLLEEELPGFQRLIQVNAPSSHAFEA